MEKETWKPEVGKWAWTLFHTQFEVTVAEIMIVAVEPTNLSDLYYFVAHGRSFLPARPANFLFPTAQAALASIKVVDAKGEILSVI